MLWFNVCLEGGRDVGYEEEIVGFLYYGSLNFVGLNFRIFL